MQEHHATRQPPTIVEIRDSFLSAAHCRSPDSKARRPVRVPAPAVCVTRKKTARPFQSARSNKARRLASEHKLSADWTRSCDSRVEAALDFCFFFPFCELSLLVAPPFPCSLPFSCVPSKARRREHVGSGTMIIPVRCFTCGKVIGNKVCMHSVPHLPLVVSCKGEPVLHINCFSSLYNSSFSGRSTCNSWPPITLKRKCSLPSPHPIPCSSQCKHTRGLLCWFAQSSHLTVPHAVHPPAVMLSTCSV